MPRSALRGDTVPAGTRVRVLSVVPEDWAEFIGKTGTIAAWSGSYYEVRMDAPRNGNRYELLKPEELTLAECEGVRLAREAKNAATV